MAAIKAKSGITLSTDQQNALEAITGFIMGPETKFVVKGYSGAGKSTLVDNLFDQFPQIMKMVKLIDPKRQPMAIEFTATTNKAADSLQQIVGTTVRTIHSVLGLRYQQDVMTGKTIVTETAPHTKIYNVILVIDEASMLDTTTQRILDKYLVKSKVIYIGDPDQLVPEDPADIFDSKYSQVELKTVLRQQNGNPIKELGEKLRIAVHTRRFPLVNIDGKHLIHHSTQEFEQLLKQDFASSSWHYSTSKVLARTNKVVQWYNNMLWSTCKGRNHFTTGDYVLCNSFLPSDKEGNVAGLKTDELVYIMGSEPDFKHGVTGRNYLIRVPTGSRTVFVADDYANREALLEYARENNKRDIAYEITHTWADLRPAYASTVHKAQGSTYKRVYIDLDDLGKCWDKSQLARLLYVAVTRASEQVIFTGDI